MDRRRRDLLKDVFTIRKHEKPGKADRTDSTNANDEISGNASTGRDKDSSVASISDDPNALSHAPGQGSTTSKRMLQSVPVEQLGLRVVGQIPEDCKLE
jgi:hypothetical protein